MSASLFLFKDFKLECVFLFLYCFCHYAKHGSLQFQSAAWYSLP